MKILAVCNTPYQIICVYNIKKSLLCHDSMDVIVSNHIKNGFELFQSAQSVSAFSNVFYIESFDFCRGRNQYAEVRNFRKHNFAKITAQEDELFQKCGIDDKYDVLLVCNWDRLANVLYRNIAKHNTSIRVHGFEDGYSTYLKIQGDWIAGCNGSEVDKIYQRISGKGIEAISRLEVLYLYHPERLLWDGPFEKIKIPQEVLTDTETIRDLNLLFGYDESLSQIEQPIIFFEECFRTENVPCGDVALLELISEWVGKENIIVKPHPRIYDSVYKRLGYKTIERTQVPWEIMVLNKPYLAEKLWLSISSGSIMTPNDLFGIKTKSVILKPLLYGTFPGVYEELYNWLESNVFDLNKETFYRPTSYQELKDYILRKL